MNIGWDDLLLVLLVGLAAGAGIVALFSFGVAAYAGKADAAGPPRSRPLGYVCFGACGLLVLCGIYLAVPNLHHLF